MLQIAPPRPWWPTEVPLQRPPPSLPTPNSAPGTTSRGPTSGRTLRRPRPGARGDPPNSRSRFRPRERPRILNSITYRLCEQMRATCFEFRLQSSPLVRSSVLPSKTDDTTGLLLFDLTTKHNYELNGHLGPAKIDLTSILTLHQWLL